MMRECKNIIIDWGTMNLEGKPVAIITRKIFFFKSSLGINTICSHTLLLFLQVFHNYKMWGGGRTAEESGKAGMGSGLCKNDCFLYHY